LNDRLTKTSGFVRFERVCRPERVTRCLASTKEYMTVERCLARGTVGGDLILHPSLGVPASVTASREMRPEG
jgi:hypothetical protein